MNAVCGTCLHCRQAFDIRSRREHDFCDAQMHGGEYVCRADKACGDYAPAVRGCVCAKCGDEITADDVGQLESRNINFLIATYPRIVFVRKDQQHEFQLCRACATKLWEFLREGEDEDVGRVDKITD